jgi:hypothetical protein
MARGLLVPDVNRIALIRGRLAIPGSSNFSRLDFGLGHLVLPDEVLNKVILSVTGVGTVRHVTGPPFQLAVPFALMPYPVSLPFE